MNSSNIFAYIEDAESYSDPDAFVARVIGKFEVPEQLIEYLFKILQVPSYFGINWNALFDFLRDFYWISQKEIVIVHHSIPCLAASEMKIYLETLRDAVLHGRANGAHHLCVIFNQCDRSRVDYLLNG